MSHGVSPSRLGASARSTWTPDLGAYWTASANGMYQGIQSSTTDRSVLATLLVAVVALSACGDDGRCAPGRWELCASTDGGSDDGVRVCSSERELSECFPFEACNPLTQEGCSSGTYCFATSASPTFCAPADAYPCAPGETARFDQDGPVVCRHFCNLGSPDEMDPENCGETQFCGSSAAELPDGVGVCWIETDE